MRLHIQEEGHPPVTHEVESDTVSIGRASNNDVVLQQAFVSGRHLRIIRGLLVEDLGSRNRTYLDGQPIDRPTLIGHRTLTVGGMTLEIQVVHDDPMDKLVQQEVAAASRGAGAPPPADANQLRALLEQLVREDHAGDQLSNRRSAEEIFLYEAYRFIRRTEKTITDRAGELTKKLSLNTRLPGQTENFHTLMAELFVDGDRSESHERVSLYLAELLDWLPEFVKIYESSAMELMREVQKTLTPEALAKQAEIPSRMRALGLTNMVLWRRAQERLDELTDNYVMDRLDALAREAANRRLEK